MAVTLSPAKPEIADDGDGPGLATEATPSGLRFPIGALVEYHSTSSGKWIAAKVTAYNASKATYNLDCKPEVPPIRIRPRPNPGNSHNTL
eukprot:8034983-Karenia_brevis.AAC.1